MHCKSGKRFAISELLKRLDIRVGGVVASMILDQSGGVLKQRMICADGRSSVISGVGEVLLEEFQKH